MRLSLCVDPGRPWPQVLELARRADSGGWHAVYLCDHFMPHDRAGRATGGPMLECLTVLAALAVRTTAVRLGSLVLGNTCRHPAVVGHMAASLDQISQGRLVLGIGAGWDPNEHAAYGIRLPPFGDRVAALDEACAVIRSLAGHTRLLVGGGGQRVMKVAARHADVWHAWVGPSELASKNAVLDRLCEAAGRSPRELARATGATVRVRSGPGSRRPAGDQDVRGTLPEVQARLAEFSEAGADEFIVRDDANLPVAHALAQVDTLTRAVLPGLTR